MEEEVQIRKEEKKISKFLNPGKWKREQIKSKYLLDVNGIPIKDKKFEGQFIKKPTIAGKQFIGFSRKYNEKGDKKDTKNGKNFFLMSNWQ
jgi:NACalpha-BTF3-like transcription factor